MSMGKPKEWRMQAAQLALAYMAGGDPPYQAARKTGFMRVAIMEEAIKEMEKEQGKAEHHEAVEAQTTGMETPADCEETGKTEPVMSAEYRNAAFCIHEYEPKDGKDGMVRIWAGARPQYIWTSINRVPMLIDLLKETVTGREAKPGMDEKSELIRKKDNQILKLQRELSQTLDQLQKVREDSGIAELEERTKLLTAELDAERLLNQKLKDKVVELLLGT